MRLIGITGFKGSGKDTTYGAIREVLRDNETLNIQRVGFADKLKIMAAKALGFIDLSDDECIALMNQCKDYWQFDVYTGELAGDTRFKFNGRQYLQWFGGEARKVFGDTFWIDQVLPHVAVDDGVSNEYRKTAGEYSLMMRYPSVNTLCVTDVRYPNEAQRIIDLGGEIWEIVKPGLESDGHGSEIPLPRELVDVVITNDKSIPQLRFVVAAALKDTSQ